MLYQDFFIFLHIYKLNFVFVFPWASARAFVSITSGRLCVLLVFVWVLPAAAGRKREGWHAAGNLFKRHTNNFETIFISGC